MGYLKKTLKDNLSVVISAKEIMMRKVVTHNIICIIITIRLNSAINI